MAKVLGNVRRGEDSSVQQEEDLKRKINPEVIEPLEFENKEQERSLADLKQANMVEDEKENPFDKWDESEKTPEYLESCMSYMESNMSDKENAELIKGYHDELSDYFGKHKDDELDEPEQSTDTEIDLDEMAPNANTVNMTPEQKQFDAEGYKNAMRRWAMIQQQYDEYNEAVKENYLDGFYAGKNYDSEDLVEHTAKTGDSFVDAAVAEAGSPEAEKAPDAPDAKEFEKEIEPQANPNEPAGQLQSIESETKTEEQVNGHSQAFNDKMSKMMAEWDAKEEAYNAEQQKYEDIQTPIEKSMKRYC